MNRGYTSRQALRKKRPKLPVKIFAISLVAIVAVITGICVFGNSFAFGTKINDVNCSFCKVESVANRLQKELEDNISFSIKQESGETVTYRPSKQVIESFE